MRRWLGMGSLALVIVALCGVTSFQIGSQSIETVNKGTTFRVSGGSMEPTLGGETTTLFCNRCGLISRHTRTAISTETECQLCGQSLSSEKIKLSPDTVRVRLLETPPRHGDVVAVHWKGQDHVKRVVAVPGDTIQVDRLTLFVNGRPISDLLSEATVAFPTPREDNEIEYRLRPRDDRDQYPLVLLPKHYFVLGDNVRVSVDSRNIGAVHLDQIIGIVEPLTDLYSSARLDNQPQ